MPCMSTATFCARMVSNGGGVVSERKGLFQTMSAEKQSSIMSCSNRENSSLAAAGCVTSGCSLSRRLFRPWALAFIGLSLSVTLWGFGYKLSRYSPHSDASSRALLAKLWDKHQDDTQITAAAKASVRAANSQVMVHAVFIQLRQPPNPGQCRFLDPDECQRFPVSLQPVVPLRSPPSCILAA
jgi:hypothetical protein